MRGRSVLAAVAVVVSLSAAPAAAGAAPSSWPQFGFGAAHTFVNPHETTLSASTVPGLAQAWIASPGPNRPTDPVVADGNVYTVEYTNFDPSKLVAKKAATGATAWSFHSSLPLTSPIVVGSTLYTATMFGTLYALDAHTGSVLRSSPIMETRGLVYAKGVLYAMPFGDTDPGSVGAYDAATGGQLWTSAIGNTDALPSISGGELFAAVDNSSGWSLVALDPATGNELWSKKIGPSAVGASPVVSGHLAIVVTDAGHMIARNVKTGRLVWDRTFTPQAGSTTLSTESTPAVLGGVLYLTLFQNEFCTTGNETATIMAVDGATGATMWTHVVEQIPCAQDVVGEGGASPVVANGLVYVSEGNAQKIGVFSTAGQFVTEFPTGEYTIGTPVVARGRVFVSTTSTTPTGFVQAFAP